MKVVTTTMMTMVLSPPLPSQTTADTRSLCRPASRSSTSSSRWAFTPNTLSKRKWLLIQPLGKSCGAYVNAEVIILSNYGFHVNYMLLCCYIYGMLSFYRCFFFFVVSRSRCIRWRRGSSQVTPPSPALLTHREDFTLLMSWGSTRAGWWCLPTWIPASHRDVLQWISTLLAFTHLVNYNIFPI